MKNKLLKTIVFTLIISIGILTVMSSASTAGYVTDGLVGFFDGDDNTNGSHDKQSTTWKDLSGKGNDITVTLNETNSWKDNGYHLDSIKVPLPDALMDVINGDEFTLEIVLDNFESKGSAYNPFINCGNDSISFFRRISNDVIEFKNDGNERPVSNANTASGYLASQVTLTITYVVGGESTLYINGEKISSKPANNAVGADSMFFGHDDATRNFATDYECIRFYDKALTAAQVATNYSKDTASNPSTDVSIDALFYLIVIFAFAGTAYRVSMKKKIGI